MNHWPWDWQTNPEVVMKNRNERVTTSISDEHSQYEPIWAKKNKKSDVWVCQYEQVIAWDIRPRW